VPGLEFGILGVNPKQKTANLYDGGVRPFSATLPPTPLKPSLKSRGVQEQACSHPLRQKQLVEAHEKVTGSKYETTVVNTEDLKIRNDKFAAGDHSGFVNVIARVLWGEGFGSMEISTTKS
jgi:hypothetical protein